MLEKLLKRFRNRTLQKEKVNNKINHYSIHFNSSMDDIRKLKQKIKSLKDEEIYETLEEILKCPAKGVTKEFLSSLKQYKLYFSIFPYESGKYDLFLGKIKQQERRSKSSDAAIYESNFICVEPLVDISNKWFLIESSEDIIFNSREYTNLSKKHWEAKQKGDLSDEKLFKFIEKRKNIKKDTFISQFSMTLMNDAYKEIVQKKLELNEKLVSFLKKRNYAYYEFIKTGKRKKGYEEKDFPKLNEELMDIVNEIGDNNLKKGLTLEYIKREEKDINSQYYMNKYFIKFNQFITLWPYDTQTGCYETNPKVKGEFISTFLQKVVKNSREKFKSSSGDYIHYHYFSTGKNIIQGYFSYWSHSKKNDYFGYANYSPNIVVEYVNEIENRAKEIIKLFLNVKEGNTCFEELDLKSKLEYLAFERKQEGRDYTNHKINSKFIKHVKEELSYMIKMHEEEHLTTRNKGLLIASWQDERYSMLNQIFFSNPQLGLAYCVGHALSDEKSESAYTKAVRSILSHFIREIKKAQRTGSGTYTHVTIGSGTLKNQISNFYLLNPKDIKAITKKIKILLTEYVIF